MTAQAAARRHGHCSTRHIFRFIAFVGVASPRHGAEVQRNLSLLSGAKTDGEPSHLPHPVKVDQESYMETEATPQFEEDWDGAQPPLPEICQAIEDFLEESEPARLQSEKTMAKYLANYSRRHRLRVLYRPDLSDEMAPIRRRTYLFNRAALIFGTRERLKRFIEEIQGGFSTTDECEWQRTGGVLLRAIATVRAVAPPGDRVDEPNSRSRYSLAGPTSTVEKKAFLAKTSKRKGLTSLGQSWREKFWSNVDQRGRYATQLATLDLTGARPNDQALGGRVKRIDHSTIEVNIKGSKPSSTTGIPERTFRFDLSQELALRELQSVRPASRRKQSPPWVRPPVLLLADLVPLVGAVAEWGCNLKGLASAVSRVGKQTFPRHGYKVSPLSFRHEFATDLKSAGTDPVEAAAAMSHRSTSSLYNYGYTLPTRRGRRVVPKVVSDTSMVRKTSKPAPSWVDVRSQSAANNDDAKKSRKRKPIVR